MTCTPDKAPTRCLAVTPTQHVGRDLCVSQEMSKAQRHHFICEALLKAQGTADPKHALCLQGPHHCHIYILYPWEYDQKFIQNPVAALSRTPPLTGTGKKQDGRREHKKYGYS